MGLRVQAEQTGIQEVAFQGGSSVSGGFGQMPNPPDV
jgi:hypothetical protein